MDHVEVMEVITTHHLAEIMEAITTTVHHVAIMVTIITIGIIIITTITTTIAPQETEVHIAVVPTTVALAVEDTMVEALTAVDHVEVLIADRIAVLTALPVAAVVHMVEAHMAVATTAVVRTVEAHTVEVITEDVDKIKSYNSRIRTSALDIL